MSILVSVYYYVVGGPVCVQYANGAKAGAYGGSCLSGCDSLMRPADGSGSTATINVKKFNTDSVTKAQTKVCDKNVNVSWSPDAQMQADYADALRLQQKTARTLAEQQQLSGDLSRTSQKQAQSMTNVGGLQ